MKINNNIRWSRLAILLLIMLLLPLSNKGFSKAETTNDHVYQYEVSNDYRMLVEVRYGYDNYAKYGRHMGIHFDISNFGKEFKGTVHVMVPKAEKNVLYSKELHITKEIICEFDMVVPVTDDTGMVQIKIENENGRVLVDDYLDIKIGNYDKETYVGILSDHPEGLNYFNSLETKAFHIDVSHMAKDYLGLELLDVIVINQFDTKKLSKSQWEAIHKWVINGGTLVLGTGKDYKEVLHVLNNTYDITSNGDITKNINIFEFNSKSLTALKERVTKYLEERKMLYENIRGRNDLIIRKGLTPIRIDTDHISDKAKELLDDFAVETVKKDILQVSLADSRTIVEGNNMVLMQDMAVGKGTLQLFSYDLGLGEKDITTGYSIVSLILEHLSPIKQTQLDSEYYGNYVSYGIVGSLSYTDMNHVPNVWNYVILLLIYIFLVGPLTYFILKKLDKRSLTWLVVPVLAILFTAIAYLMGSETRIKAPYAGYLELITFGKEDTVLDEVYFSLTSPQNDSYTTVVDSKHRVTELRDSIYNYEMENLNPKKRWKLLKYVTSITDGLESTEIEIGSNPAFSPLYYQVKDTYHTKNELTYQIDYYGAKVSGTVYNGFDFDLNHTILINDGSIVYLDTLPNHEEITVEDKESSIFMVREELYNSKFITKIAGGDVDAKTQSGDVRRKIYLLQYLIDNNLYNLDGSYIIGFVDESIESDLFQNNLVKELKGQMDAYGSKVIILPITINYSNGDKTFVPSIDSFVKIKDKDMGKYYEARYLDQENTTLEYVFPEKENIVSFELIPDRNKEIELEHLKNFNGSIYFFNNISNSYDEVFKSGLGSQVTNVKDYISKDNRLLVKYEADISLKGSQTVIPNISYWKEASYVKD